MEELIESFESFQHQTASQQIQTAQLIGSLRSERRSEKVRDVILATAALLLTILTGVSILVALSTGWIAAMGWINSAQNYYSGFDVGHYALAFVVADLASAGLGLVTYKAWFTLVESVQEAESGKKSLGKS